MAVNGVYIVLGEANNVVALLNKARRQYQLSHQPPTIEDTDPLLRNFTDLKEVLNEVADLSDMNPLTYLSPFLDVVKAQNTNGPITESALSAVAKFLSYGLIDANSIKASKAVESIAYAVVHTKFIGGKSTASDECVLYKILQVLRSLLLSPPGFLLSNEAVCDLMQSCFRIVFEQNLSLLLRKAAEATLADMTQLIFTRLPTFAEDTKHPYMKKLKKGQDTRQKRRKKKQSSHEPKLAEMTLSEKEQDTLLVAQSLNSQSSTETGFDVVLTTDPPVNSVTDPLIEPTQLESTKMNSQQNTNEDADSESDGEAKEPTPHGLLREIASDEEDPVSLEEEEAGSITQQMPYGLPCCRELLRFLIALTNPLDRQNTESMVVLGLNLLIVALEAAADHLSAYTVLMPLIRDNLCRSLLQLLDTEKLPVLAATNRCCFLLFESMRWQLKFQLEAYFRKLQSIVLSEQHSTADNGSEQKEMALESLVQHWRIPGLVTELYLNYDCDLYCSNIFEDLTKLLVENSFPKVGGHTASLLSLDALLVVIDTIDQNCVFRQAGGCTASGANHSATVDDADTHRPLGLPALSGYDIGKKMVEQQQTTDSAPTPSVTSQLRVNRHGPSTTLPSMSDVIEQKKKKRIIAEGTEIFNQSPKKGIEFLREKGLLGHDPASVVQWLRTNPQLDKKSIADYICSRKQADILDAFVKSFPFEGTRLDTSLRMFLETFRLPGESAEISMVMQSFSEEWYRANNEPFNHVDAAFTLSYAIIMLNMDQHNPQVRRNMPTMTVDCFKRNLSGTNGSQDFDSDMLVAMYNAIKSEEIVMPAEQTGLVKENYLWKVLLRRGETPEGEYHHAPTGWNDHDLFSVCWGPAIAALSYVFDKSENEQILQKALNGYRKCASIAAHYGMKQVFDNLTIHLCKFTTLTLVSEGAEENVEARKRGLNEPSSFITSRSSPEAIALAFGENHKAQLATKTLFELVHANGDILKESWRNVLEVLLQLFKARLLPPELTEVEDFVDEKGWVSIQRVHQKVPVTSRSDAGLLSWFGLGVGAADTEKSKPTESQLASMKLASSVIADCRPGQLITDSKYLTSTSLGELLRAVALNSGHIAQASEKEKTGSLSGEDEDAMVFYLELMVSISMENKDRLKVVWQPVRQHLEWLLSSRFGRCPVLVERTVVGLLRNANRNLFRDNTVADEVLHSLELLMRLSPKALYVFSRQIAYGLNELIRTNAANVHKKEHWDVLFSLMEAAGAAVVPDDYVQHEKVDRNAFSDGERSSEVQSDDRGYTSDVDRRVYDSVSGAASRADSALSLAESAYSAPAAMRPNAAVSADWIHLDHNDAANATADALRQLGGEAASRVLFNRGSLMLRTGLGRHEPAAFLKVCETLAFLLRDGVHVTPDNFEASLNCLRTMVEASLNGGYYAAGPLSGDAQSRLRSNISEDRVKRTHQINKKELSTEVDEDGSKQEEQQLSASYQQVSLHLIDLCAQLHQQAPAIFVKWQSAEVASVSFVWNTIWRPLLQAIARLASDCRRLVRGAALTHLQRAFLPTNMTNLGSAEWESCFGDVLFPLLAKLVDPFSAMDPIGMEDTRVRAIQIVAKTLLNHLTNLSELSSFPSLWIRLLDFMLKYLKIDSCGNLTEAVPESLKNLLLVVDNTKLFATIPGLYEMTVERLHSALPQLLKDTISHPPSASQDDQQQSSQKQDELKETVSSETVTSTVQALNPSVSSTSTAEPIKPDVSRSDVSSVTSSPPEPPVMIPLTEVVVHSGPTSPVVGSPIKTGFAEIAPSSIAEPAAATSPPVLQSTDQHYHQTYQHQQPVNYPVHYQQHAYTSPQQEQYYQSGQYYQQHQQHQQVAHVQSVYSPEQLTHATNYMYQHPTANHPTQQPLQYPAEYYNQQSFALYQQQQQQQQAYNQQMQQPTVHAQHSRVNPLPTIEQQHQIAPSQNSAFTHVKPEDPESSPYFKPIPYPADHHPQQ